MSLEKVDNWKGDVIVKYNLNVIRILFAIYVHSGVPKSIFHFVFVKNGNDLIKRDASKFLVLGDLKMVSRNVHSSRAWGLW